MAQFGLGSGNHLILMMLYHHDGISQNRIAHYLHVDKALTARSIKKLIELGYVRRERDEQDARAYRIYLTEKGWTIRSRVRGVLEGWSRALTQGLSAEERETAMSLLERMAQNAVATREGSHGGPLMAHPEEK